MHSFSKIQAQGICDGRFTKSDTYAPFSLFNWKLLRLIDLTASLCLDAL